MTLHSCKFCGRRMVLRNGAETWKTRCALCWKDDEGIPYNGSDLYILHLESQLDAIEDQDNNFITQNIKKFIKLCHPDRHSNSPESTEVTRWLIDQYQNRLEEIPSW